MDSKPDPAPSTPTVAQGRWCIVLAALLWSTSGAFTKVLTLPTGLGLDKPDISPMQITFYRGLFAGLVLVPFLRRHDVSFRPLMIPMAIVFAVMSVVFISALSLGSAADAIVLQYTAPMWMFVASVWWLGERADYRSFGALSIGLIGIAVIVLGSQANDLPIVGLGLASGVTYAGVMIFLRVLRDASSRWLTVINLLSSALVVLPFVGHLPAPSWPQLGWLFVYGALQMGLPYWLVARGVRSVSPQEAGIITLLEPLFNPLWAYLVSGEQPPLRTVIGGGFIVGALAWRYWPSNSFSREPRASAPMPPRSPEARD